MRRKIIVVVSIIAILLIAFMAMSYFAGQKESPEINIPESVARRVKALPVSYKQVSYTITSTGRLGSQSYVDVIAEVQGEILPGNLPLKKGQRFLHLHPGCRSASHKRLREKLSRQYHPGSGPVLPSLLFA